MKTEDFEIVGRILEGGEVDLITSLTPEQKDLLNQLRALDDKVDDIRELHAAAIGQPIPEIPGYIRERLDRERALFAQTQRTIAATTVGPFEWFIAKLRHPGLLAGAIALLLIVLTPVMFDGQDDSTGGIQIKGGLARHQKEATGTLQLWAPGTETTYINPVIFLSPTALPSNGETYVATVIDSTDPAQKWTAQTLGMENKWSNFRPETSLLPERTYRIEISSKDKIISTTEFRTIASAGPLPQSISAEQALSQAKSLRESGRPGDALMLLCSVSDDLRLDPAIRLLRTELSEEFLKKK